MEAIAVTPILSVVVLFLLMGIMIVLFVKMREFLFILIVFLFSLIIGVLSISEGLVPFTPYFQLFFLTFQTILFFITSFNFYEENYGKT